MLSVGKMAKGQENYYLETVAKGVEDYYLGSGEAPGKWLGKAAAELQLQGEVLDQDLIRVMGGLDPASSERLGRDQKGARVPGFDLTFSAPKSVSVMFALGEGEASNEVSRAHDVAVTAALGYIEREAARGRRGDPPVPVPVDGLTVAAFRHRTSRAGDPALHTHCLVANVVRGAEDGKWGALDARQIYAHAKTAGYLYQAQLRAELTRRLGVEWSTVRNGHAEVVGVPQEVVRVFSKRREEILERMAARGDKTAKAAQVAALDTRAPKDYGVKAESLIEGWREAAGRLGFGAEELAAVLDRAPRRLSGPDAVAVEEELASKDGLTKQASTFTRRDVLQAWCERLPAGAEVARIEELANSFIDSANVVGLGDGTGILRTRDCLRLASGRRVQSCEEERYSTPEMLALERALVDGAFRRVGEGAGKVSQERVRDAVRSRPSLSAEQLAMVTRLTSSGDGIEVVSGRAGAGKTYALDAAREAWERDGQKVIGCALAARAARELQSGAGIESYTIDGLLRDLHDPQYGGLGARTIIVVDESGMVGTRKLDLLLRQAQDAHAKVVLVGDDRQLPEIDAGGAFRGLQERLSATELVENRRQRHDWERDALELLREGKSEEAIAAYQAHDRVIVGESADVVRGRMVADWWATKELGEPGVMIAARKVDVADLNYRARELMLQEGEVRGEALSVAGGEYAEGDRVMTLRNSRALGVTNGTRGQVEAVDPERKEVRMRTDEGEEVTLPSSYLEAGHLTHAYAITGHKAQGMTTSHAFVLGDETVYREWGYVAMSRGTDENRLYVVGNGREMEDLSHGHNGPERGAVQDVASAMATSRAKSMAIEMEAPGYIQQTLGDRPLAPAERQRWSRAVWAVQEYRDRYGIDDEERALGSRPKAGLQRADYDVSARTVEKAIGRQTALDRGIELRQEQGLGLSR